MAAKLEISGLVRAGTEKKEGREKRNREREKGEGREDTAVVLTV